MYQLEEPSESRAESLQWYPYSSLQKFFLRERRDKLRREKQVSYTRETECTTEFNTRTGFINMLL